MNSITIFNQYFEEISFSSLMKKRITHILLICSKYDTFILEEDGRIDEQIFMEYVSLNLRYPPQFIQVSTAKEAFKILKEESIDLIINMLNVRGMNPFELSLIIKKKYTKIPIVVLTPFSKEISLKLFNENTNAIDYKFSWLGNSNILVAIVKLIEDKMNAEYDIVNVGVQAILLIEDSIRFYSSYLPNIYKIIFEQSKKLTAEGLNEHQRMLRMRGRPKILLATTYEEAIEIWNKYKKNLLGVISDISFNRNNIKDKSAGIRFVKKVKSEDPFMPLLLQSSDKGNEKFAKELNIGFLHKHSRTLSIELRNFIIQQFQFGDFVFLDPKTKKEINRVSDLKSLQEKIFQIPDDSVKFHINNNHFSKWLNARALFPIAKVFRQFSSENFKNIEEIKYFIFDTIARYRMVKGKGVIATFNREQFDEYLSFTRIGNGSLGGKGRGLAFLDFIIKKSDIVGKYNNISIKIPRTLVLCTDIFDEFMESNNLYKIGLSDSSNEEILMAFISCPLPFRIHKDLYSFLSVIKNPIAIRSSSLLEDSHYQPFAGVYSTYMIPKVDSETIMIEKLSNAIKSVYASVYFKESKAYMMATSNLIDDEKMAIVLQEVCGSKQDNIFYPTISGTARSINFYPIAPEKTEDGIVNIALGLGKQIVEGGQSLRFSPKYPKKILQLSSPETALRETQKEFYALDLNINKFVCSTNDGINIQKLKIKNAEDNKSLNNIISTYDFQNNVLRDGSFYKGKKLITFSNILKHNTFPLPEIINFFLKIGQEEMNNPIEIEFAVNISPSTKNQSVFNILQIRPIIENKQETNINIKEIQQKDTIAISNSSLGNGIYNELQDILYVKPESFNKLNTNDIAKKIDVINSTFTNKNFILIGPGRWGSSDSNLGIPVKWSNISSAKIIIELGLNNFRVDPSQGTHFFQNLTSFHVGYFTINPYINDGFFDIDFLNNCEAQHEDEYLRLIHFSKPLNIKVDGKKGIGIIFKPK